MAWRSGPVCSAMFPTAVKVEERKGKGGKVGSSLATKRTESFDDLLRRQVCGSTLLFSGQRK